MGWPPLRAQGHRGGMPPPPPPATWADRARADAFREKTIRPTLEDVSAESGVPLAGTAAEELLLGTALHESGGLRYREQLRGPALGLFQVEPFTHDDMWRYLDARKPALAKTIRTFFTPAGDKIEAALLRADDGYAVIMARVKYLSVPAALPPAGDLAAQAAYWKKYYNTPLGKGTVEQYIADWHRTYAT